MAFEEDPVMRRIAAEFAEARMRAGMPFPRPELGEPSSAPAAPTSEPGIPEPVAAVDVDDLAAREVGEDRAHLVLARDAEVVDRPVDVPRARVVFAQDRRVALAARRQVDEPPHAHVKQALQPALDELGMWSGQDALRHRPVGVGRDASAHPSAPGASLPIRIR